MEEFSRDETKFDNSDLLEPFSFYNLKLKDAFHDNAEEYFEKLTKRAGTDIELNRDIVKKYNTECVILYGRISRHGSQKHRKEGKEQRRRHRICQPRGV